jgi:hypothetical protein
MRSRCCELVGFAMRVRTLEPSNNFLKDSFISAPHNSDFVRHTREEPALIHSVFSLASRRLIFPEGVWEHVAATVR